MEVHYECEKIAANVMILRLPRDIRSASTLLAVQPQQKQYFSFQLFEIINTRAKRWVVIQ